LTVNSCGCVFMRFVFTTEATCNSEQRFRCQKAGMILKTCNQKFFVETLNMKVQSSEYNNNNVVDISSSYYYYYYYGHLYFTKTGSTIYTR